MTLIYTPGEIRVGSWSQVLAHRDVEVWSIDCDSKYASWTSTVGDDYCEVWLLADDRTLRLDPVLTRPTIFTWPYPGWDVFAVDGGRYEVRVCLWKRPRSLGWRDRAWSAYRTARYRLRGVILR